MSLATDRAAIAQALDAVTDITGYDDSPPMLNVGDAWVRWAGYENTGALGLYTTTWKIFVIGGGTPFDAMSFIDNHLTALLYAIEPLAFIVSVRPVEFDPNVLYGAEITAQKES